MALGPWLRHWGWSHSGPMKSAPLSPIHCVWLAIITLCGRYLTCRSADGHCHWCCRWHRCRLHLSLDRLHLPQKVSLMFSVVNYFIRPTALCNINHPKQNSSNY